MVLGTLAVWVLGGIGDIAKLVPADPAILVGLLVGGVVVGGLLLAYRAFLAFKDKAKGSPFLDKIKGAMARTPSAVADPAKRARLDDLRKKYEEGVDKFRQAGKDLYSLPWYLLVGPAGSGKTEAMRHCKVGFPPGLQDCFQGAGGTLNMHWWFTNHAVVLDTAGRMFMEEAALQGGSEWREFLKMLKQSRPTAPMNGMLLVIGIDSLIKDTAEQIEGKAGHIAKQLDTIQRTLDVRFPVYVVITKCDLITGFREFFDKIDDPQLQHQILGWSNPSPLDEPFRAETIDDHVRTIRSRLLKRRSTLLMDPVHTEDPQARRTDQVDELFALPDNMAKIAPRLRRYLEIIFQAGEWSPKPLFLRGIYFTSSMRQGKALDEDLAAALGVNVDAIPGGKVYDEERSFFLRDVFTAKIFREKGLVTRATNVQREQTGRKRLLLGAGIGVAAALIGLTFYSSMQLKQSVRDPLARWGEIAASLGRSAVVKETEQGVGYFGRTESEVEVDGRTVKVTPLALLETSRKQSETPLSMGFLSFGRVFDDVNQNQKLAHRAVVARLAARPLAEFSLKQLESRSVPWSMQATGALAELVAAETRARGGAPARDADAKRFASGQVNPAPLLAYLVANGAPTALDPKNPAPDAAAEFRAWGLDKSAVTPEDFRALAEELRALSAEDYAAMEVAGTDERLKRVKDVIRERASVEWGRAASSGGDLGRLKALDAALDAFRASAKKVDELVPAKAPPTLAEYNGLVSGYAAGVKALKDLTGTLGLAAKVGDWNRLRSRPVEELAKAAEADIREQADRIAEGLPADLKAEAAKGSKAVKPSEEVGQLLRDAVAASVKDLPNYAREISKGLEEEGKQALLSAGVGSDERGYQAVVRLFEGAQGVLSKAEAPADWLEAEAGIGQVNKEAEAGRAAVADWEKKVSPALAGRFRDTASRAVEAGRGGRVGALAQAFLTGLDTGKALSETVEAVPTAAATTLPRVAMTDSDGTRTVARSFSPAVANRVFQGWASVGAELAGKDRAWVVAEPATAERLTRLREPVTQYGTQYSGAWRGALTLAEVRKFEGWSAFAAAMKSEFPDPLAVHEGLKRFYGLVQGSLQSAGTALQSKDLLEQARQVAAKAQAVEAAGADPAAAKISAALSELTNLGAGARDARAKLVAMVNGGPMGLLVFTRLEEGVPEYWPALVQRGAQAVSDEYQKLGADDVKRLRELARFPLVDGPASEALSVEEVRQAKVVLDGLPVSGPGGAVVLPSGRLGQAMKGLVESQVFREYPGLAEYVRKAKAVADVLTQEDGTNLVRSIQGAGDERALPDREGVERMSNGLRFWTHGENDGPPKDGDRESVNKTKDVTVRTIGTRAGGQALGLYFSNDANPVAERVFKAPWAAIELVLTPGSEVATPGAEGKASVWLVPIVVKAQGSEYKMWIQADLKRAVPTRREWPRKQELDQR